MQTFTLNILFFSSLQPDSLYTTGGQKEIRATKLRLPFLLLLMKQEAKKKKKIEEKKISAVHATVPDSQ